MKNIYYFLVAIFYFPKFAFDRYVLRKGRFTTGAGAIGDALYVIFGWVAWSIILIVASVVFLVWS